MRGAVTGDGDVEVGVAGTLGVDAQRGRTVDGGTTQSVALHCRATQVDRRNHDRAA